LHTGGLLYKHKGTRAAAGVYTDWTRVDYACATYTNDMQFRFPIGWSP
jgi:hypothetical protein